MIGSEVAFEASRSERSRVERSNSETYHEIETNHHERGR